MFEDSFLKSDKNTPRKALSFPGALIIHAFIIGAALSPLPDLPKML
jgi:hypothetical protein